MEPTYRSEDAIRYPDPPFEDLLLAELPYLRRYARGLCGNPEMADDLVQDCVERALRKRRLWRPGGRLRSWLMRILYRIYLNRRKRAAIERRHAEWRATPYEPVAAPEPELRHECRELAAAIDALPEAQRAVVLLVALEDVDYREGAWILGIPVGTLRSRLSRGREALRRHMNDDTADTPALHSVK